MGIVDHRGDERCIPNTPTRHQDVVLRRPLSRLCPPLLGQLPHRSFRRR